VKTGLIKCGKEVIVGKVRWTEQPCEEKVIYQFLMILQFVLLAKVLAEAILIGKT